MELKNWCQKNNNNGIVDYEEMCKEFPTDMYGIKVKNTLPGKCGHCLYNLHDKDKLPCTSCVKEKSDLIYKHF